jgi:hypothetical protein
MPHHRGEGMCYVGQGEIFEPSLAKRLPGVLLELHIMCSIWLHTF